MQHTPLDQQQGFTLAELTVALVIIAVLMAVVLKGAGLIDSAKTNSLVATIKDLSVASRQFKERYRYWPGDLPNADAAIPNLPAACVLPTSTASIGDGQINTATEVACAIEELFQAGMIKADLVPATGMHIVTHESETVRLVSGATSNTPNFLPGVNIVEVPRVKCTSVMAADLKIDDGDISLASNGRAKASVAGCVTNGANDPVPFYGVAIN